MELNWIPYLEIAYVLHIRQSLEANQQLGSGNDLDIPGSPGVPTNVGFGIVQVEANALGRGRLTLRIAVAEEHWIFPINGEVTGN